MSDLQPVRSRYRQDPAERAVQMRRRELERDQRDALAWLSGKGRAMSLLRRLCGRG